MKINHEHSRLGSESVICISSIITLLKRLQFEIMNDIMGSKGSNDPRRK